jgi:S1-C subfamily serine protease
MVISQGSGFLYDDQGHVVTNAHVVSDRNEYLVRFGNSSEISATVIGRDEASDLAVLALSQPVDIAPLQLSQRTPMTGMWVMTIGNPLGLRDTMTLGTISAVGRTLDGNPDTNILQIDAAVNPGSSGGVLIDVNGAVIGITTAIQSSSGSFEGIGYAIPADAIRQMIPILIGH